ncbi:hypothetical protein PHYSODRAFT_507973 [Phytophthora sojae]|uniref:Uncharacterized protein n=1 Tax=Phytophthora sojae (strain P6497) TaxID=1094619 RepID=G4ZLD0_PHYSP|nr:hypothetical protein PHYSODRAFT_507973 [Phytophthora sojae]EGZ15976.1 hypothetical protein PHYSODRAFT_507973 [Phytophthora sojae]|eukprot:XP_009529725.1 hypothetical protein PHYSODRAFT_507973 [Phytophthora sojae]
MMKQELIAYSVSWDPLMKVLQALGAFMAKQQRTQQGNDAAMKKMEDQVAALRGDLARAEDEKKEAAAAMEAMQNQVGEMQNQLEEIQGLAPIEDQEEQQGQQGATDDQDKSSVEGPGGEKDGSGGVSPTVKSPRSPRASSIGRQPFVTAKELDEAKKELQKEMKRALAHAFGQDFIDEGDENEDGEYTLDGNGTEGEPDAAGGSTDGSPRGLQSRRATGKFQLPGAPFASAAELQQEVEKLQGLQDALNAKVAEHDQLLEALNGRMGQLNAPSSGLDPEKGAMGATGVNEAQKNEKNVKQEDFAATTNDILNELKELKAVQDEHDQKLRDHDEAVEKHTADIKALADSLDDLSVQQQTVASMYATGGSVSGGTEDGSAKENASTEGSGKSDKNERQAGKPVEAISQPHLDLSLVFTKLADLRRSTDASLNSLQQSIKGVSGTTQSQQEQLDALRNNVVFNEHLQAHLVEARLTMQKELLARNQTFQDRIKPQLVEWRKALELTEDKLLQGNCDDETLHALQQMQRCYHRTLLSIAPLVNSPLSIAETLQTLSDEVKQLQNAVRLGVVPLRVTDYNNANENSEGEPNKEDREEEYTRKLRYLDEEIDATLQVNITTEKKNDPLIKGLDAMREKLELLWSMWHRNFNAERGQPSGGSPASGDLSASANAGADTHAAHDERRHSFHQRNPESLREMELRLSGAVRRLAMVEEDIERLNSLTAHLNASDTSFSNAGTDGTAPVVSRRAPSTNNLRTELVVEEIEKLRKEMYAEIAKLSTQSLGDGNGGSLNNSISSSSLVSVDRRSMVEAAAKQGDVLTDLYSQMTGRELDTRLYNSAEGQKQFYDNFIKEVTKKVSAIINADKGGPRGPGIGGAANANVNYRLLLDNFAQKVDDRLEDAREFTTEELARLRRELMEQLKIRFEDYERPDDEFVFRAGFKMPANDRKILTLPFLTTAMRNKMVLNKPEGKRKRPPRQSHLNRVDNVVREAMELDRASRGRAYDAQ